MMMGDHFADAFGASQRFEQLGPVFHVALHRFPFIGIERAVLVQDRFHDSDFSNVMQHAAQPHFLDFRAFQADGFGNQDGVAGNLLRVALRELILGIDGERQRRERIHDDGRQRLEGRLPG